MPYVKPELIEKAKEIDLLTYLETYEPDNIVKVSSGVYCTREHDSLKISNGKWMWWSRGFGGYNALDYLTKVKGVSFLEAVNLLIGTEIETPKQKVEVKTEEKKLILPKFSKTTNKVFDYLVNKRGIDADIVKYCIDKGIIKESLPYHNVVFIGVNNKNIPCYAAFRATNKSRVLGDCTGSDKSYSFRIDDVNNDEIHLFESAIDLLSYATLIKDKGLDFTKYTLISLAGVYLPKEKIEESKVPITLSEYLKSQPNTNKIIVHFDNDIAGRLATKTLKTILPKDIEIVSSPSSYGKDVNDYLCHIKGISRYANDEVERN